MKHFALGLIVGSLLTAGVGLAGSNFYNSEGRLNAPSGSVQQFDYFRQRQLFLDAQALRRAQERSYNPCAR